MHGAIGLLADGGGTDSYLAVQGVGQGMGLDMGLGALEDDGGDDAYERLSTAVHARGWRILLVVSLAQLSGAGLRRR